MRKQNNIAIKVFISICILLALIKSTVNKGKNEELSNMKNDLSSLQEKFSQKEIEIQNLTNQNKEADAKTESDRNLMAEEIKTLSEKVNNINNYIEANLSTLSQDIISNKDTVIINLIKKQDFKELSKYVHPVHGLTLSSSTELNQSRKFTVSKSVIASWDIDSSEKIDFGVLNGQGQPIKLTLKEYYDSFIYDVDYLKKGDITYNKYQERDKSKKINIYEVYKDGIVVEYFFNGSKENKYVDWSSLYLGYEKYNDEWYLSGIFHS